MTLLAASQDDLVTVLVTEDVNQQALAEAVLGEFDIPFVVLNDEAKHLFGMGAGGFATATGPPEIQVAASHYERANELIREALTAPQEALEDDGLSPEERAADARATQAARRSAAWSLLDLWGITDALAVFFGFKALGSSASLTPMTKGIAIAGAVMGLLGFAGTMAALVVLIL